MEDWNLIVPMLSINPDAATRDEVARLAAELMEANHKLYELKEAYKHLEHLDVLLGDESKWKIDREASKDAILYQMALKNKEEPLSGSIHKGLWYLCHRRQFLEEDVNILKAAGGRAGILASIKAVQIQTGQPGTTLVSALGIARLINKKRRTSKIVLPDTE